MLNFFYPIMVKIVELFLTAATWSSSQVSVGNLLSWSSVENCWVFGKFLGDDPEIEFLDFEGFLDIFRRNNQYFHGTAAKP
jgi:hypothetical protein